MKKSLGYVAEKLWWVGAQIVAPLRKGETPDKFTLAIPETHTTSAQGDTGWSARPPARVKCPQCEAEIYQYRSHDTIDCSRCTVTVDYETFSDLEVLNLECPKCREKMKHGQRHPGKISVPEWADCDSCGYHWEFKHSF